MNERIKELKEQAEEWNADGDKCEVNLQKFAELLIRECGKEAFEFWCKQVDCNEESAQSHILTHFGVE